MTPAYWMFQVLQVSSLFKGGQWPVRQAEGGGADRPRYRKNTISVYSDVVYAVHIRNDIVFCSRCLCILISGRNIGTISGTISLKKPMSDVATYRYVPILTRYRARYQRENPISGPIFPISVVATYGSRYVSILSRYQVFYPRYQPRYRDKLHDFESW